MLVYNRIQEALDRFEEAKTSKRKVSVSEIARKYGFAHGSLVDDPKKVHSRFKLYIYDVFKYERYACSFPLAWKYREVWIYGVPDLVVFENGVPIEIWEVKTYSKHRKGEVVQLQLYGWLTKQNFDVIPRLILALGFRNWRNYQTLDYDYNEKFVLDILKDI